MQGSPKDILNTSHGETVGHTPSGGSNTDYTAIVDRDIAVEKVKRDDGDWLKRTSEVVFWTDDVEPAEDSKLTFDSLNWDVTNVLDKNAGKVRVTCVRYEKLEDSDENFRRSLT